jgi:hypothetical protein
MRNDGGNTLLFDQPQPARRRRGGAAFEFARGFYPRQSSRPAHEDAFRPINPNTLVPVLVEGDKSLWETDAIACRLSQIAGSTYADFRAATIMPFAKEAKMPVGGYKNILEWAGRLDEIDAWRTPFEGLH